MASFGYNKNYSDNLEKILARKKEVKEVTEETTEEVKKQEEATERIKLNLSETLKFTKQAAQQEAKRVKAADDLDKSYASLLGNLIKGNFSEIASFKKAKETLGLTGKLRTLSQEVLKDAKDESKLQGLSAKGRKEIFDLTVGISDGMYGAADAAATLENLSKKDKAIIEKKVGSTDSMAQSLKDIADISDQENASKEKTLAFQNKLNARLGVYGAIFGALLAIAKKFADSVDAIGKQFGSLNVQSDEFKSSLMDAEMEVTGIGATMEDVVATTSALAGEFGLSLTESADLSAQVIDTAKAVGLTNEEAAKLSGILQTTSGLSAEQAEQLTEGAFQLAVANNVAPDAVMKDLASSAEEFASFSKDGGDNLVQAAIQARALGLSLQDTAKISEGLLNFQDSITKEVEASVLIGRQLNLQKARELALNNDLEGAMKAVVDQLGSEQEFNKLNAIQRKALADSIGVEVSQLAKMVANQEKANDLAGETAKSFQDIIGKEAMSELTATMNELKIFGVAIANTLGPLLMGLAKLVNLLLVPLGNMVVGISSAFRGGFGGASMDDGVVGPGGISMMAGSAGVFKLNPRDSVMATTNPIPVNDIRTGPPGSMGGGTNVQISSKMVKLGGGDLGLAIDAYTYPKNAGSGRTTFDSVTGRV